jgi:acetyl-CoA carboxylase biotin carboxyl carrier protein
MLKVQEINELIKLIDQSSINEFSYEADGATIAIKKTETLHQSESVTYSYKRPQIGATPAETQIAAPIERDPEQVESSSVVQAEDYYEIVSPMVGTFYAAPSPDVENFVKLGSKVEDHSIVCIVEAMKLFNEIEAEVTGEIVEILVKNGELVEFGQLLFRVKE